MSEGIITLQFGMNLLGLVSICFFPILGFSKELKVSRKKIKKQNKFVYESISYAKYIQNASLNPEEEVIEHLGRDAFLFYRPKDIVSGDFYWCYKKDKEIFLVCSDCTGH
jgi:serine phosphatase RsbU (regulator of sigma subunit)